MSTTHRIIKFVGKHLPIDMCNPDVVKGEGCIAQIPDICKKYGTSKPLIVTDAILMSVGVLKPMLDALDAASIPYAIYDKVEPNPHTRSVEEGAALYKESVCDGIIAFGGGSPMDCAKMIGGFVVNPKPFMKYHKFDAVTEKGKKPLPPLIAIPTTAGTASETSPGAVITIEETRAKIVVVDKGILPKVAVLDPVVLAGLPPAVTAATGMDALTHAVESYISVWRQPATIPLSLGAVETVFRRLPECVENGANLAARQEMLQASFNAGRAFSRANLGYVHGIAHQFGGMFGTPHGVANAMVLPYVLEAYAARPTEEIVNLFAELSFAAGLVTRYKAYSDSEKKELMGVFIKGVRDLSKTVGIPTYVKGMTKADVDTVVKRALSESHGEVQITTAYPSPMILEYDTIAKIVTALLPPDEISAKL